MTRFGTRLILVLALTGASSGCDTEGDRPSSDAGRTSLDSGRDAGDANTPRTMDGGRTTDDGGQESDATYSCEEPGDEAGSPEGPRVQVASIHVTASTNAGEIDVAIYDDASAERTLGPVKSNTWSSPAPKSYPPHSPEVEKFLCDLGAIPDLSAVGDHVSRIDETACGKSGSNGTLTTVTAGGLTSGDVQCLVQPTAATSALADDCVVLTGTQEFSYNCVREPGFFEGGTRVPMSALCGADSCPATLSEALDAVHDDPTSAEPNCGYSLASGCGVETVGLHLGTHSYAYHFSTATGLLIGAELGDDLESERARCVDWSFLGGETRPPCTTTDEQDLCGAQDDAGL